jgi:hypothetical protein
LAAEPGTFEIKVLCADVPSVLKSLEVKEHAVGPEVECVPPRVPYARTYVLLPPGASEAWVEAILDSGAWDKYRWTIGSSADDAGVGPMDRRVIAVNPEDWPDSLQNFFDTYYPGAKFTAIQADSPGALRQVLQNL